MQSEKIKSIKDATNTAFFRFKKLPKGDFLITNDYGNFHYLNEKDFYNFAMWKITSGDLFETLKKKNFIKKNKDEVQKEIADYRKKNWFLHSGPSLHIVITTLRCNHACRYCHAAVAPESAKEYDMTIETAQKVIQTIFYTKSPVVMIEFQWGESLLNWPVIEYMTIQWKAMAKQLNKTLKIALVTNLTLMTEEKFKFIKEQGIEVSTSLDGDKVLHNHNRTWKGWDSFERVTYWIKRINKEYEELTKKWVGEFNKIWALLTTTKRTLKDPELVINEYLSHGLDGIFLRPLNPYGFAENDLKNLAYSSDEFIEFYEKAFNYILELNKKWIHFRESYATIFLTKILTAVDGNFLDERSPCWACIGQIAYNYDWKIYSCDEWRMMARWWIDLFQMWEVRDSGLETYKEIMASDATRMMVNSSTVDWIPGYNENVYKPYIWVCPINSYKTNGTLTPNHSKDFRIALDYKILDIIFDKLRDEENLKIFETWVWEVRDDIRSCN